MSVLDEKFNRMSFRQVIDAKLAGSGEEIVCDTGAVAIARVGFVGGQFNFIDLPVRLQFFEFVTIDELTLTPSLLCISTFCFSRSPSPGWTIRTNPVLRKSPSATDHVAPVLEHLQAHQSELDLGWIAVVHADQRRGASAAALSDVAFVDDCDFSRFALREMKRDGRTHYAGTQNHDIGCRGFGRDSVNSCRMRLG